MLYDVQLYVGHDVKGIPTHTRNTIADAMASVDITGATFFNAVGIWNGAREDTTVVEICNVNRKFVKHLRKDVVPELCKILEQEAIMFRVHVSNAEFISALR